MAAKKHKRPSRLSADCVIRMQVGENPHRPGSQAARVFATYHDGITCGDARQKLRRRHKRCHEAFYHYLRWNLERGEIEVERG